MIQVKSFTDDHLLTLQEEINTFIRESPYISKIISIQYATINDNGPYYSALVVYQTKDRKKDIT